MAIEGERTGGAVLVARAIQESEVWGLPPHYLKLWIYLLLNVRWDRKPHRIGSVTVGFGQVVKSYRKIAEENQYTENQQLKEWSTSVVKRMLDWMEEQKMVRTRRTDLGTLIEVLQFERYQDFATYATPDLGTDLRTPGEHPENNRKQEETEKTTNHKRARRLPADWTPNEQHQALATELDLKLIVEAEKFRDHAEANGRTLKDWDAGFRMWLRKASEFNKERGNHGGSKRGGTAHGDTPQSFDYEGAEPFRGFKS